MNKNRRLHFENEDKTWWIGKKYWRTKKILEGSIFKVKTKNCQTGQIFDNAMLVQYAYDKHRFINLYSGNRVTDDMKDIKEASIVKPGQLFYCFEAYYS